MNDNIGSKPDRKLPDFLLHGDEARSHDSRKPKRKKWHILAMIAAALVGASVITFIVRPMEARSNVNMVEKPHATPTITTAVELPDDGPLWWLKGSIDTIDTPTYSSPTPPPASRLATKKTASAKLPLVIPAKKPPMMKQLSLALASVPSAVVPNPCGSMEHCTALLQKDPRVEGVLRACHSVLNGSGSVGARKSCDAIFAGIEVPAGMQENGISDEERQKAAEICNGMLNCKRVVVARPSAAFIVQACQQALNNGGSGAPAETCDTQVMKRVLARLSKA